MTMEPPSTDTAVPATVRLAQPGSVMHDLGALIGEWDVETTIWPTPDAAPVQAQAVQATSTWALGQRYLVEHLRGTSLGAPYERMSLWGYNALLNRQELTTCDTLNPGFMTYFATHAPDGVTHFTSTFVEAGFAPQASGRFLTVRFDIAFTDADHQERAMYFRYPDAPEFLTGHYRYQRRRA